MTTDQAKLKSFVERCCWAYITHQHYKELFEGRKSDLRLFEKVSHQFFVDLNRILIEHLYIQIHSLTDRDKSYGKEDLTINNLLKTVDWPSDIKSELENKVNRLMDFGKKIATARNKLIARVDLKAHLDEKVLGGFEEGEDEESFLILEETVNVVHEHLMGGPYSIRVSNAFEPVEKFLRKLRTLEE